LILGLNLPNYSRLGNRESMIAIAQRAEELGYSSLWTSDHILIPANRPEPFGNVLETFTTLSFLAARTETIRLGTGILVLPQRDPLLAAKQAATIHQPEPFAVSTSTSRTSTDARSPLRHRQVDHLRRPRFMEVDDETPLLSVIAPDSRSLSKLN